MYYLFERVTASTDVIGVHADDEHEALLCLKDGFDLLLTVPKRPTLKVVGVLDLPLGTVPTEEQVAYAKKENKKRTR